MHTRGYWVRLSGSQADGCLWSVCSASRWRCTRSVPHARALRSRRGSRSDRGTQHGLPQASVNTICQTPDGYIWLGTNGGLVRFDGVAFETFDFTNSPIPSIRITSLILDHAEGMWVATEESYIVPFGGGFQTICQVPATPYQLVAGSGDLLAITRIGLYEIRGDSFRLISEANQPIKPLRPIRVWLRMPRATCSTPSTRSAASTPTGEAVHGPR